MLLLLVVGVWLAISLFAAVTWMLLGRGGAEDLVADQLAPSDSITV